ncbi:hypothetical protein PPERSA_09084 [Pseudocohnilembus persalinus]|uniref:Uncharacterized protein n=1 Tax=Pseudocohnilembus persalinus TaxID=266149 RepID=A0A0V0Q7F2_PSEPJ|nr:hypothetical protein PPERSA_09084 [Pseudocohnilembus persalinus]|eukprot:KRW98144.1 hypothetical protein PPERSA_09084 [Pseudocohnilembus persalinus]
MWQQNLKESQIQEPMKCKKIQHFDQQFIFFKFSEKIDQILQCASCSLDDPQLDKKIIIDQIFKLSASDIKNFPPLNEKKCKEIKNLMQNFTKEKNEKFKQQIKAEIDDFYYQTEEILHQFLAQSKKEVVQEFDNILKFIDISQLYDIDPIKQMIEQYQEKQIDLQELFEKQLEMKKSFEQRYKFENAINQEKNQKEVKVLVENLKLQLDQKMEVFKQKLIINTDGIKKFCQQENQKNYQQIKFFKSQLRNNFQEDIRILNDIMKIEIEDTTAQAIKQVHSEGLDKKKTHHLRMKIDFYQQNKQGLIFYLLGENDKDKNWDNFNFIFINNCFLNCGARNGERQKELQIKNIQLKEELDFQTILNVVFNYQGKLFEVYDDKNENFYVKSVINQDKIKGESIMLGIKFQQFYKSQVDMTILECQQKVN